MENHDPAENGERRNSNTEYVPTKCRITKPPPPKPAANPLQFIKVAPCPLFQKAHEQIKKVEEIKKERKEIREETEDWQQNLDNWKSSRRKRQEHIIERVVEVKKFGELEEQEKSRRKSKTFSEMIEDRSRGRHKFTIPIYDDDSNDLSDYGIGSSSSKTNSIKDVDTDDSSSILDDKDHHTLDSPSNKDSSVSNQSQSEDETNTSTKNEEIKHKSNININNNNNNSSFKFKSDLGTKEQNTTEQYTYEGAIQDYRSRIQSKIHVDESIFTRNKDVISKSKEFSEAQSVVPKGEIFKRKELFEVEKPLESNAPKRLSEEFGKTKSIKDRLKSLEKSSDSSLKKVDKSDIQVSVKQRLENFNKQNEFDNQNNNINNNKAVPNKISNYLLDKSNSTPNFDTKIKTAVWKSDRCSSPETEIYMNKLNMFNRDLDNLVGPKNMDEYCSNYPPSTSSIELTGTSSDREDSGIHTADVSCSVSQADEPVDTDTEVASNTIPHCIEKLNQETEQKFLSEEIIMEDKLEEEEPSLDLDLVINQTNNFLEALRKDSSENLLPREQKVEVKEVEEKKVEVKKAPNAYENVTIMPLNFLNSDFVIDGEIPLIEPPKFKPPPPPPPADEEEPDKAKPLKRLNSTKRIKKEIHIKRSSFLGLDEPTDDQIDPEILLEKPPDINSFLQKESKLEKSMYKKILDENRVGVLSKVESQDSGLDIDRGRLSSDTWCSSIGDSSIPSHERQDSEVSLENYVIRQQSNSITSEEDEISKKEREIIEMIEKEEQSRDNGELINLVEPSTTTLNFTPMTKEASFEPSLGSEQFNNPYFPEQASDFLEDQDSEVLKVEHELRQLEREEMERQRENILFRESRAKARLQNNRHSLENICDEIYPTYTQEATDYRKSMPELQIVPLDYRQAVPDVPNTYRPDYRKSMPNIQHTFQKNNVPERTEQRCDVKPNVDHRKSMPELQQDVHVSAFKATGSVVNRQPIMPGVPLRPKDPMMFNPIAPDQSRGLNAAPRQRHSDNWIQPKANPDVKKSYNQHWVFQEAELRRISEQQKNAAAVNRNSWQQPRLEKHLPDSIIQSLTQRVQTRVSVNDRPPAPNRRSDSGISKPEYIPYKNHALPMPYAPPVVKEEAQDRMLSVSGKKKCSYCGNELGRGAAMIIESLCLFYHMECFKCCVCHVQLGNGLMGTDVRVRNQKLHCHNCYSSDDGVKFSCV